MKLTRRIAVTDKAKNFLISREAVSLLFNGLRKGSPELELDFSNVEFISRSYADQFYKAKAEYENRYDSRIYIVNANEEIINMLHAVAKTQNISERTFEKVPVYRFSKIEKLSDYFLSI